MPNLYIALVHHPVVNKCGERITAAVTNLDLHDISRAAKTYGVRAFYVVTPLSDQKALVQKIVDHWIKGKGAVYNPKRRDALELITIMDSIDEAVDHVCKIERYRPLTVATCARPGIKNIGFDQLREMLQSGRPYLLLFGTAWGFTEELMTGTDYLLAPIQANTGYNHLSVRSAVSIILDRLLGNSR
ncbi:MAG: RNA methyltransferase [Desulfobacterales bacterium]|nr:RNA methyltransferase [Desulfobacterales bacterium]